jgi:hypothetical protein
MPIEATELDSLPSASDASEFEEYPTQVQQSPFEEARPDEAQTTTKRGPEFAQQLAQARGGVRDTDAMGKPPAVSDTDPTGRIIVRDTDATGRPAVLRTTRAPRRPTLDTVDPRDDQETIIKSSGAMGTKRKPRKLPTADDTIRVDPPEIPVEGDETQLMATLAPKLPRR